MAKTAATSKASRKNQTTIPARVRKALKVAKGDTLLWTISGDEVTIKILPKTSVDFKRNPEMSLLDWSPSDESEAGL